MSNAFYTKAKTKILTGKIDFSADTIKAALVKNTYTYSAGHEFLTSLDGHVADALALATPSVVDGVFDAEDLSFPAIPAGSTLRAIVLYKDTGVPGTSSLIAYLDDVAGLPASTSGAAVNVVWPNTADKILAI